MFLWQMWIHDATSAWDSFSVSWSSSTISLQVYYTNLPLNDSLPLFSTKVFHKKKQLNKISGVTGSKKL